uniref:Uncharacterized protein n=1 Tax=Arundo donax TaxID=35708 RepID=A0A0A9H2K7_ARUDO
MEKPRHASGKQPETRYPTCARMMSHQETFPTMAAPRRPCPRRVTKT